MAFLGPRLAGRINSAQSALIKSPHHNALQPFFKAGIVATIS
jgi:hypothetical protein